MSTREAGRRALSCPSGPSRSSGSCRALLRQRTIGFLFCASHRLPFRTSGLGCCGTGSRCLVACSCQCPGKETDQIADLAQRLTWGRIAHLKSSHSMCSVCSSHPPARCCRGCPYRVKKGRADAGRRLPNRVNHESLVDGA